MRHQLGAAVAVGVVASLVYVGGAVTNPDVSPERAPVATQVRVMTWNVCGESGACRNVDKPDQKAAQVANLALNEKADAVLLQEVCGDDAKNDSRYDPKKTAPKSLVTLLGEKLGDGWRIAFTPYIRPAEDRFGSSPAPSPSAGLVNYPLYWNPPTTSEFRCRGGYNVGVLGVAIAVRGTFGEREEYELPSPRLALWLKVLCVRRTTDTPVRFCTSHHTPFDHDLDPRKGFSYRAAQVQRLGELIGGRGDTVFGGDFNSRPPDDPDNGNDDAILAPLYAAYRECEQGFGSQRKGTGTMWDGTQRTTRKYDYLFSKESYTTCKVVTTQVEWSDHLPVVGTVSVTV